MKKLILFVLMAVSSLYSEHAPVTIHVCMYKSVSQKIDLDSKEISFILSLAVACAHDNEQPFETEKYEHNNTIFCKLYNVDYSAFIFFNIVTRDCVVQWVSYDDSFDYVAFKRMIEFFLIDDVNTVVDNL